MIKINENLKTLLEMLEQKNVLNQKDINRFIEKMSIDPATALEWSKSVFKCSAELKVNKWLISAIKKNKKLTLEDIKKYLQNQILSDTQYGHNSTSVPSNFMNQELDHAWAKLYNMIKLL